MFLLFLIHSFSLRTRRSDCGVSERSAIHDLPATELAQNGDSPAGRWRRRRTRITRITRTIDGFTLFASMAAPVPVFAVVGIVGRRIIGAGTECAAEKKQDQFPFPEAA